MPLKVTAVAPLSPVPSIVTVVSVGPLEGEKLLIVGVTVNEFAVVTDPAAVVTVMGPVVAVPGTTATIFVAVSLVILAAVPLNWTDCALIKPFPVMVTLVPTGPFVGTKLVTVGVTVKFVALVAVPPAVTTITGPVDAPPGTTATICAAVLLVMLAAIPSNVTDIALPRLVPVIVTDVPTGPNKGAKLPIAGAGIIVKELELIAVPNAVVTEIGPVVAPFGTTAVSCVPDKTV